MLTFLIISFMYMIHVQSLSNLLCDKNLWTVIKGNWNWDCNNCLVTDYNQNVGGDIVWIDNNNHNNYNYNYKDFDLEVIGKVVKGNEFGVLFRISKVTNMNDLGAYYYCGVYANSKEVKCGYMTYPSASWNLLQAYPANINYNQYYKLNLIVINNSIKVFLNNNYLFEILNNKYLNAGSIGLRTYLSDAVYSSLTIYPLLQSSLISNEQNLLCNKPLWSIIKGVWKWPINNCNNCMVNNDNVNSAGDLMWIGDNIGKNFNLNYFYRNFELEMEGRLIDGNEFGVIFRADIVSNTNDLGSYYYCGIYIKTKEVKCGFSTYPNKSWNQILQCPITNTNIKYNQDYKLNLVVIDNTIKVFFNNYYLCQVTNDKYMFGGFGLRTYNAIANYNSLKIRPL